MGPYGPNIATELEAALAADLSGGSGWAGCPSYPPLGDGVSSSNGGSSSSSSSNGVSSSNGGSSSSSSNGVSSSSSYMYGVGNKYGWGGGRAAAVP